MPQTSTGTAPPPRRKCTKAIAFRVGLMTHRQPRQSRPDIATSIVM